MDTYLVGGAVRDELLGLPVRERDWVVVGATPEELVALGYRPVGRDFPVFLHPDTGEEYALARTERKTAPGHGGFVFHTDPSVTLEMDLVRRDLTINAMARSDDGLVDPCGGRADLEARVLRHVSPAFVEDPLRVLRVARFAARFHGLGFTVAPETRALMAEIAASGELDTLTPERVWSELALALTTEAPGVFFEVLADVGAMPVLFPLLTALEACSADRRPVPLAALDAPAREQPVPERFAALFGGAALEVAGCEAPDAVAPDHADRAEVLVREAAQALRAPRAAADPALQLARFLGIWRSGDDGLLAAECQRLDPARRPERLPVLRFALSRLLQAEGVATEAAGVLDAFLAELPAAFDVDVTALRDRGLEGAELGAAIAAARRDAVLGLRRRLAAAGAA